MRHLLFALLIALLPLRGWMGDAMATQMAAGELEHQATQAATHAAHVHASVDAPQADHDMDNTAASHDCGDQADHGSRHAANGHCGTCAACQACQACHTVGLSLMAPALIPVPGAHSLPRTASDLFASADAALRKKPPIS